ncbi:metallophosphoesterase [Methylobacter sp. S3L5C]|uniref:metallophosphoesterase n=1 Tax=Methylobacter sp. S3L5C TaxID=2839024 RepID=UPI001FAE3C6B|nr:metallophosphoesterase [Methylobacter sp. S3L5C]UOA07351.1 metallophosphoesterase [Methylobacter sp. S3L5C]
MHTTRALSILKEMRIPVTYLMLIFQIMALNIAHLSDIHFSCDSDQIGHNPNEYMRNELVRDLVKQTNKYGGLHAIIISGDIAYGGKVEEYKLANDWIQQLCAKTDCPITNVFICPGNHDIDHDVLKKSRMLEDAHKIIRSASNNEQRNAELINRLQEPNYKKLFYEPLGNYNDFAKNYNSCFFANRENYAWSRDLELNDGSILRIRGLNSAILSGQKDNKESLFLGRQAWSINQEDGVEYLAFSHHPPIWLLDGNDMLNELNDRARIQLYGHEHSARIERLQETIKLYAGAVNPHRDQSNWSPGYNFLQISVHNDGHNRIMKVKVHALEWQDKSPAQFKVYAGNSNDDGSHEVDFKLSPWTAKSSIPEESTPTHSPISPNDQPRVADPIIFAKEPSLDKLLFPFMYLDRQQQKEIIEQLNLKDDMDNELTELLKLNTALQRAKERGQLTQLEELIKRMNVNGH